jgi:hypothetical protein
MRTGGAAQTDAASAEVTVEAIAQDLCRIAYPCFLAFQGSQKTQARVRNYPPF